MALGCWQSTPIQISASMSDVFVNVQGLMADLFDVRPSEITEESTQDCIKGWDSLQHVNLMIDLENAFGIQIEEHEVSSIRSVADVIEVVEAKRRSMGRE
jgi:acyl carrier protein